MGQAYPLCHRKNWRFYFHPAIRVCMYPDAITDASIGPIAVVEPGTGSIEKSAMFLTHYSKYRAVFHAGWRGLRHKIQVGEEIPAKIYLRSASSPVSTTLDIAIIKGCYWRIAEIIIIYLNTPPYPTMQRCLACQKLTKSIGESGYLLRNFIAVGLCIRFLFKQLQR